MGSAKTGIEGFRIILFNQADEVIGQLKVKVEFAVGELISEEEVNRFAFLLMKIVLNHLDIVFVDGVIIVQPGCDQILAIFGDVLTDDLSDLIGKLAVGQRAAQINGNKISPLLSVGRNFLLKIFGGIGIKKNQPFKVLV